VWWTSRPLAARTSTAWVRQRHALKVHTAPPRGATACTSLTKVDAASCVSTHSRGVVGPRLSISVAEEPRERTVIARWSEGTMCVPCHRPPRVWAITQHALRAVVGPKAERQRTSVCATIAAPARRT
jgi:hypothetical protein